MTISSNTLFHFKRRYEYFIDYLKNGLWPRYCIEPNWNGKTFAIPMVCFCDIPLSQIQQHVERYGKYAIGVTKDFAKRNNITPVLYLDSVSELKKKYLDRELSAFTTPSTYNISFTEMMFYYIKRVEGKEESKQVKFYNEREWRYVPPITTTVHLEIVNGACPPCNDLSIHTKGCRILLTPNDIEYLIVRSQNKIPRLCRDIDKIYHKYKNEDRELLKTKILSIQQIKKDF